MQVKTENICGTCRHLQRGDSDFLRSRGFAGTCNFLPEDENQDPPNTKVAAVAYTVSGGRDADAVVYVAEDFGCNQWEQKRANS